MGSGVAGAIKRAGGARIEREAVALGPIEIGDAVATGAGRLAARHVIRGAVMGQDLKTTRISSRGRPDAASRWPTSSERVPLLVRPSAPAWAGSR
jgi:Macro domain